MPIHSDEFEFDMASWLIEKSCNALRHTCALADWLHSSASELTQKQHEAIEEEVRGALRYLTVVVAFAAGRANSFNNAWPSALYHHGEDAVEPFVHALSAPFGERPAPPESPSSIETALRVLEDVERMLQEPEPVRAIVRTRIGQLAGHLGVRKLKELQPLGAQLLQLINRQAVDNEMAWPEFVRATLALLAEIRTRCAAIATRHRWSA